MAIDDCTSGENLRGSSTTVTYRHQAHSYTKHFWAPWYFKSIDAKVFRRHISLVVLDRSTISKLLFFFYSFPLHFIQWLFFPHLNSSALLFVFSSVTLYPDSNTCIGYAGAAGAAVAWSVGVFIWSSLRFGAIADAVVVVVVAVSRYKYNEISLSWLWIKSQMYFHLCMYSIWIVENNVNILLKPNPGTRNSLRSKNVYGAIAFQKCDREKRRENLFSPKSVPNTKKLLNFYFEALLHANHVLETT